MTNEQVDTHDPAGMARWLRERAQAAHDFLALDSEAQQRHYLQKWQQNVLPHLAFRFEQAAQMLERLSDDSRDLIAERDELNEKVCGLLKQLHSEPAGDLGGCSIACEACGRETVLRYTDATKTRVSIESVTGWEYSSEAGVRCPSCIALNRRGDSND